MLEPIGLATIGPGREDDNVSTSAQAAQRGADGVRLPAGGRQEVGDSGAVRPTDLFDEAGQLAGGGLRRGNCRRWSSAQQSRRVCLDLGVLGLGDISVCSISCWSGLVWAGVLRLVRRGIWGSLDGATRDASACTTPSPGSR